MPNDTEPAFETEDTLPFTEESQSGELDHDAAEDDSEVTAVSQADAEPGPDHPSDPAVVPIQPEAKLSEYVALSPEEMAEKGKQLAKKLVAIEGLEEERKDINHQIKDLETEVVKLRNSLISGTVEVMTEQTDLLRQPIEAKSAAAQFAEMGEAAAQAAPEAQEAAKTEEDLNAMARDIQAGVPGTEPSEQFQNAVEEFKAKAAKRKSGKAR